MKLPKVSGFLSFGFGITVSSNRRSLGPFDCPADVGHVVALSGKRDPAYLYMLRIFSLGCVDARNVFEQARIDLIGAGKRRAGSTRW
jgi:hypothetical protein